MKNTAASVRARLSNLSRAEGVSLDFMIERFAIGRLLWRLSKSPEAHRFVLKGAQLFSIWQDNPHRPTRDIDFLGFGDPTEEAMRELFTALCSAPADSEDGLIWGRPKVGPIREDQRYGGIRLVIPISLAGARVRIQVDIENSRMKDFYDLDWLACHRSFNLATLREAVERTFEQRQSELPVKLPLALTPAFADDSVKRTQWNAFLRKNQLEKDSLGDVVARIRNFLAPVILDSHIAIPKTWHPKTGWTEKSS